MAWARALRSLPLGVTVILFAESIRTVFAAALDLDRTPEPAMLCQVLEPEGIDLGSHWRESRAIRGGWVCERGGRGDGKHGLSYRVLGSGPNKIDRLILTLDLGDHPGPENTRVMLARAGERVAAVLGIRLSPQLISRIEAEPISPRADWRATAADSGRRLIHDERQGWVRVRLAAEQSTQAALILSFDNPNASGLWR